MQHAVTLLGKVKIAGYFSENIQYGGIFMIFTENCSDFLNN